MLNYSQILGDAIKRARLQLGLTQSQLAEQIDVDVRTVLNIENYKGNPKLEVLFPLIRALKIDPSTIFYPELFQETSVRADFQIFLSSCSDDELQSLLPISESVVSALRSKNAIQRPED